MEFLHHKIVSLKESTDFEKTTRSISEGVSLRGYNLWILICAALLASIGLDTNSTAVIIGAMLISPLMSPILGVGFSLAIHDKKLLTRSLRNLAVAVVISLSASIVYFLVSPLSDTTPELEARTFPTLLDVMVALFGGIAGIVSISRKGQTNAIPGVAIATALMPPLCTAGFGIATGKWSYFLGAFYLFFINAVFISFATYIITRYLRFPETAFANKAVALQYRRWFVILSIAALSPSVYFLYTVYKKVLVKQDIDSLVIAPIKAQGNEIIRWETADKDSTVWVKVYHSGRALTDSLKRSIDSSLSRHHLTKYHLLSMRVNLTKEEVSQLSAEMTRQMFQEMHLDEIRQPDTVRQGVGEALTFTNISREVKIAFPFIDTLTNGWMVYPSGTGADTIPVVSYSTKWAISRAHTKQLYNYLLARLSRDTVALIKR